MRAKLLALLFLSFSFTFANNPIDDWGQTGHRVVGEVASQYLNKKAKRAIFFISISFNKNWQLLANDKKL